MAPGGKCCIDLRNISGYLDHKDEVEQVIAENRRAEEAWVAANPTPPDIVEKFERMRRQMLARRG